MAVPISEALRADLARAVEGSKARPELEGLRWTDPRSWHLTLAFLGTVDPDDIHELGESIAGVAASGRPFVVRTGGLDGFPSATHARVAWYAVADPEDRLARIADRLASALGLDPSGPLRAHVTLARARREPVDLSAWREAAGQPAGILEVASLDLMRSHLGRGPAHYEIIRSTPLGIPTHV